MHIPTLIERKRDGAELSPVEFAEPIATLPTIESITPPPAASAPGEAIAA
jgi:hypothetical protein